MTAQTNLRSLHGPLWPPSRVTKDPFSPAMILVWIVNYVVTLPGNHYVAKKIWSLYAMLFLDKLLKCFVRQQNILYPLVQQFVFDLLVIIKVFDISMWIK